MASKEHRIEVALREPAGSTVARRMRRQGLVPAVLYGHDLAPRTLSVSTAVAKSVANVPHVLTLSIDSVDHFAIVSDVQRDALKGIILHVDFHEVRMNEEVSASVPVETVGTSASASSGGIVELVMHELAISCLPGNLPEKIEIDVTKLHIGDHILVGDLILPEGVTTDNLDPELVVVSVVAPAVFEEPEEVDKPAADAVEVIGAKDKEKE